MTITELKKSITYRNLTEVYIDCEYAFSLYVNELKAFDITVDKEIDLSTLDSIYKKLRKNGINDALKLLARSDYTQKLLKDKLSRKKYPEDVIGFVISYLCEKGFINDFEYAEDFVKSAFKKGKGRKYVQFELAKRGIEAKAAERLICESYDEECIFDIASKKLHSILKGKEAPDYKDYNKLRDYLLRQGFGYEEVSDAVSRMKGSYEN